MLPSRSRARVSSLRRGRLVHGVDRGGDHHDAVRRERLGEIAGLRSRGGIEQRAVETGAGDEARRGRRRRHRRCAHRQSRAMSRSRGGAVADGVDAASWRSARSRRASASARSALALVTDEGGKARRRRAACVGSVSAISRGSTTASISRAPRRAAVSLASGSGRVTSMRDHGDAYAGNSLKKSEPALSRRIWPSSWPSRFGRGRRGRNGRRDRDAAVGREDFAGELRGRRRRASANGADGGAAGAVECARAGRVRRAPRCVVGAWSSGRDQLGGAGVAAADFEADGALRGGRREQLAGRDRRLSRSAGPAG